MVKKMVLSVRLAVQPHTDCRRSIKKELVISIINHCEITRQEVTNSSHDTSATVEFWVSVEKRLQIINSSYCLLLLFWFSNFNKGQEFKNLRTRIYCLLKSTKVN